MTIFDGASKELKCVVQIKTLCIYMPIPISQFKMLCHPLQIMPKKQEKWVFVLLLLLTMEKCLEQ